MKLDQTQIGGQPVKVVRDLLRDLVVYEMSTFGDFPAKVITRCLPKAKALLPALVKDGYVEPVDGEKNCYRLTTKGNALAQMRLVKRMKRAKAEALFNQTLDRIVQANADPKWLHWVTEVRVFGSYLTDSDDLGDLDLALDVCRRARRGYTAAKEVLAVKLGKDDYRFDPEAEFKRWIRNRSPRVSLYRVNELERNPDWCAKTVYRFIPPTITTE